MQKYNKSLRILLVGPLPPPLGGTTTLFKQLVEELRAIKDVEPIVVNSSRNDCNMNFISYILTGIKVLYQVLRIAKSVDVVTFHSSVAGAIIFSPFIHVICKLYKKPWILRKFGGVFDLSYQNLPIVARTIVDKTALAADMCLFETKQNMMFFQKRCKYNVAWYPNNRPINDYSSTPILHNCCRRFIFCGHVMPTKGILEIISSAEQFDSSITVDVYGPFRDGITEEHFRDLKNVRYCGILNSKEVISILSTYDVLILPTYHDGEGYPGVILEAYIAGIPVITTNWKAIPEIVDNTSGIIINPKDSVQLSAAMKKLIFDNDLYQTLCQGAIEKRKLFSSKNWTRIFIEYCKLLTGKNINHISR